MISQDSKKDRDSKNDYETPCIPDTQAIRARSYFCRAISWIASHTYDKSHKLVNTSWLPVIFKHGCSPLIIQDFCLKINS
jgi:hypothetical protein